MLSHTFTLQDSLARGFHRKYSILILMCDKVRQLSIALTMIIFVRYFLDTSTKFLDFASKTYQGIIAKFARKSCQG